MNHIRAAWNVTCSSYDQTLLNQCDCKYNLRDKFWIRVYFNVLVRKRVLYLHCSSKYNENNIHIFKVLNCCAHVFYEVQRIWRLQRPKDSWEKMYIVWQPNRKKMHRKMNSIRQISNWIPDVYMKLKQGDKHSKKNKLKNKSEFCGIMVPFISKPIFKIYSISSL